METLILIGVILLIVFTTVLSYYSGMLNADKKHAEACERELAKPRVNKELLQETLLAYLKPGLPVTYIGKETPTATPGMTGKIIEALPAYVRHFPLGIAMSVKLDKDGNWFGYTCPSDWEVVKIE